MPLVTKDLGFFGIFKASFTAIFSQKKLFLKISLVFLLAPIIISHIFSFLTLIPLYSTDENKESPHLNSKLALIVVIVAIIVIILLIILFLLSIAAIAIAVALIHLQIPLNFTAIVRRTPRCLKRLIVTFLWCFLLLILYHLFFVVFLVLVVAFLFKTPLGLVLLVVLFIVYLVGFVHLYNVISVAYVVTVLEDEYGRAAIGKSWRLLRGKRIVAAFVLVALVLFFGAVQFGLSFAEYRFEPVIVTVLVVVASCVVLMVGSLLEHVVYCVLYFVCKFKKGEDLNGSVLVAHLDAYLGIKRGETSLERV